MDLGAVVVGVALTAGHGTMVGAERAAFLHENQLLLKFGQAICDPIIQQGLSSAKRKNTEKIRANEGKVLAFPPKLCYTTRAFIRRGGLLRRLTRNENEVKEK